MILDIYKDSFEYAAKDWKTLIVLGVFCLLSFLLIPIFLITGYIYRVVDNAVHGVINGRDPLPEFNDIVDMFIDGVKVVIVQIVYLIVPIIIFLIFAAIASSLNNAIGAVIMMLGCLISIIVGIICCLMTQMGICHMAYNDGAFSKAFEIREIKEVIDEIGWFNCIITYLGLIIITVSIASVVTIIIGLIFTILGFSGAILGSATAGGMMAAATGGIFILGILMNIFVSMFIVGPYLSIFNYRSIGLLYTMQI
ncbi:MAG: DUF4013 domain-containing protein [Methanobrevibacter millerae]|uniref:DUF4013 domain-containing protein n=1 Tax=Methanobrevibacter millerae TaxID=230361 RepID=A0A8T3VAK6_9EURY|nr:DUF4013 domain-containing protein [Methanobrevibacter millerae]MBE6505048.1 DUF4013 domain-containing protein [Methanobrevibacter millerae]